MSKQHNTDRSRPRFPEGPYSVQINIHGRAGTTLREIREAMAEQFGAAGRDYVPRITLVESCSTTDGGRLLKEVCDVAAGYRPPEFRLDGFETFRGRALHAAVEPSEQLLRLRRRLTERLDGFCDISDAGRSAMSEPLHSALFLDTDFPRGNSSDTMSSVLESIRATYELNVQIHALRVTVLGGDGRTVGEYDMVLKRQLDGKQAVDRGLLLETREAFAKSYGSAKPATYPEDMSAANAANHEPATVWLGSTTGIQFERACTDILRRHGYETKKAGGSADGGRDIILWDGNSKVVVECKHQAGRVGRPAVQKLHSVVVTEEAQCGITISTGGFASTARNHKAVERGYADITRIKRTVRSARPQSILLVGRQDLDSIAQAVGVEIRNDSDPDVSGMDPTEALDEFSDVRSHPGSVKVIAECSVSGYDVDAFFVVDARLEQTFTNSTDVAVYHMDEKRTYVCKADGTIITGKVAKTVRGGGDADPPHASPTKAKKSINKDMIARCTKTVPYTGQNNVQYTKRCKPSFRNIRHDIVRRVGLRRADVKVRIYKTTYNMHVPHSGPPLGCRVCGDKKRGNLLLCNECGKTAHEKSCGDACKSCKKTVCRECSRQSKKWWMWWLEWTCHSCISVSETKQ